MKTIAKILILAFLIRIVLAPFFVHSWDMTTIQDSMEIFLNGDNPYTEYATITRNIQTSTGTQIFFEGYAYLPHLLYIYAPVYKAYLLLGGDPTPINNAHLPTAPTNVAFSPDVFLFLTIMKLPLIFADLLVVYFLYQMKPKLATIYAFSPYIILISAIWGMFDALLAVSLLLSVLLFYQNKFLSGIFFSLSLIKPIALLSLPIFIIMFLRERKYKQLLYFSIGVVLIQIPTIAYLLIDTDSFINTTTLFHLKRTPAGLTPLNIFLNIPDLRFSIEAVSYLTIISIIAYVGMLFFVVKKKISLEYGIIITILYYFLFGKVISEQLFVLIYPLLLLKLGDVVRKFDKYIIAFAFINPTIVYLAFPLLSLFSISPDFVSAWYNFLGIESVDFTRHVLIYLMGVIFFLEIAALIWFAYKKYKRTVPVSADNNFKMKN